MRTAIKLGTGATLAVVFGTELGLPGLAIVFLVILAWGALFRGT